MNSDTIKINLKDKVLLITGATSGIGKAISKELIKSNAKLILTGRSKSKLEELASEIKSEVLTISADLSNPKDVNHLIQESLNKFGRIDVLIANAGLYEPSEVKSGNPDNWDKVIKVNVNSVFRSINLVLPSMIKNKFGDIIIMCSVSGYQAIRWEPIYSATKHAIKSFAHGLRTQVAKDNIRVSSLAPGMVLTELWGYTKKDQIEITKKIESGEGLHSDDIVETIKFILSRPRNVTIRDLVILPRNQDL